MFTGIIEEIGNVEKISPISGGKSIIIQAKRILEDMSVNDSICVDGVCLTVTKIYKNSFQVDAVGATLDKTTFANVKSSDSVNLERSLKLNDRLGGHLVQGHVNGIGTITEIQQLGENYLIKINVPENLEPYLIKEGSISINGISLTIAYLKNNLISISVIPHTWQNTNLKFKKNDDKVNIEIDMLSKYIERFLTKNNQIPKTNITENWLKEIGY